MPPCGRLSGTQAGADVCGGIGAIDGGGLSTPSGPVVAATGVPDGADVLDGAGACAAVLVAATTAEVGAAVGVALAVVVVSVGLGVLLEVVGTAAGANRTAAVVVGLEDGDG